MKAAHPELQTASATPFLIIYIRLSFFDESTGDNLADRKKVGFHHSKQSISVRENVGIHHTNATLPPDHVIWHPSPQTAHLLRGKSNGGRGSELIGYTV